MNNHKHKFVEMYDCLNSDTVDTCIYCNLTYSYCKDLWFEHEDIV